jgi:hypothetical protein
MKRKTIACWTAFMCIVLLAGLPALAQAGQGRGRLTGTVHDEAGSAVPGATVWLEFAGAGRRAEAETDSEGQWVFNGVGNGKARITVMAEGFQGLVINTVVSQLRFNRPVQCVLKRFAASTLQAAVLTETRAPAEQKESADEKITRTYTLRYVSPEHLIHSAAIFLDHWSFAEGSKVITVKLPWKNIAAFEALLEKLDVERRNLVLRVFTVITAKEGRSDDFENKDLKRVLGEVRNLLNFKSYVLDGASAITVQDGADFGRLALSTSLPEGLNFAYRNISLQVGRDGKRAVKLEFYLSAGKQELLSSTTEIAEDGYLVAGVSRIGSEGKSLVLVINAEIK